jgi:hypothetical protein
MNMAVRQNFQRCIGGSSMVQELKTSLVRKAKRIVIDVSDQNLGMHLFLQNCGFRAIAVHNWRDHSGDYSTYRFVCSSAFSCRPFPESQIQEGAVDGQR